MEIREGSNQLKVLSIIAEFESRDKFPKQKEIVTELPISKGAVSNNCKKLTKSDLLSREDKEYHINKQKLLELYRTHIENYLTRTEKKEDYENQINKINEIKTQIKLNINEIIESELRELILEIIYQVIINSRKDANIKNIREAFLRSDSVIQKLGEFQYKNQKSSEKSKYLIMLSIILQPTYNIFPEIESISRVNINSDVLDLINYLDEVE
ncbi:helix-turn-helix domain-containing protein [Methanonatronarchaeum sp. AMET-Sl]|uniref:MarR family transcriptional regulator n=1 Tax=Methanonatronarchaeum sp. AMET-Sl TaxID=3037654 RepID=UPI00244DAA8A|nr:helix-turn-helix domain-containing protein [Methanonatronarchaeum sp. AMET-Sl]WGI17140.1 helix-turn-helix domain-containing protein [Methanonatronarchaeum sp. AMET-Sl]